LVSQPHFDRGKSSVYLSYFPMQAIRAAHLSHFDFISLLDEVTI
jgi:hypothetical protein